MSKVASSYYARVLYDPATGEFVWAVSAPGIAKGAKAGSLTKHGYWVVKLGRVSHRAHRLAWFLHYGEWPVGEVDHINGNRHDNRWANLRAANRSENNQNTGKRSDNTSGFRGVWLNKDKQKWSAMITHKGKRTFLGNFETPEEAYAEYLDAKSKIHTFQPTVRTA